MIKINRFRLQSRETKQIEEQILKEKSRNLQEGRNWGFLSWNGELKLLQVRFDLHHFGSLSFLGLSLSLSLSRVSN